MRRKRQRLPLNALRTFEAAARLQSFKEAADELCVSATTVSNQIRQLERDWGCLLFVRKTRQVVLTDTGLSLSRVVKTAFDSISAEIESHVATSKKSVTLAVGPIFASRWLIPRLAGFRRRHPDIELILHHGPRITSSANMTTAIAVDWGRGDWAGLESQRLLDIRYAPVVSPDLVKERGGITKPADLERFPILHQYDRTEWNAWLDLAKLPGLAFAEETVIEDSNVVVQAAIDGQGVALGIFPFVQREIETGQLLRPFEIELAPTRSFFLLTRPGVRESREIAAVCEWFEREAEAYRAIMSFAKTPNKTGAGSGL
ncbi:LysR substrate-binding domain-containing protein [Pelagibius sp. Alg239-R121]|uniref:LysR substrate-binding domain-containing protein n=1 Tax=Pelagibius sp. Alg239-R121 TaxID=2993448 RepID=UPI0024A78ABA|nr:LysR substrate-binding domain-containing protein [Pelagibius sp. Alg239-R121]